MRAACYFMPRFLRDNHPFPLLTDAPLFGRYLARGAFERGPVVSYAFLANFACDTDVAEQFAEELFDLSNNPSRQDVRELLYGTGRSLSVGDIVVVEDERDPEYETSWLCLGVGWVLLAATPPHRLKSAAEVARLVPSPPIVIPGAKAPPCAPLFIAAQALQLDQFHRAYAWALIDTIMETPNWRDASWMYCMA
jgi:hypothetical protein